MIMAMSVPKLAMNTDMALFNGIKYGFLAGAFVAMLGALMSAVKEK